MKISVIIPTFGRPSSVVQHTVDSIFNDSANTSLINEVIVIDQNFPRLALCAPSGTKLIEINAHEKTPALNGERSLVHIYGLNPSVTAAKNFGMNVATGEIFVFFDDDVTVHHGAISHFHKLLSERADIGFLAGREVVESELITHSPLKEGLRKLANCLLAFGAREKQYQANGKYVGRIFPNSLMIKNFNIETPELVLIDGGRGCIWAARAETVKSAGTFDPQFKGTSLREETDLYLRIKAKQPNCYYTSGAVVTHHRQLGGCDNLAVSFSRILSKFENELYFQQKHFSERSRFFFFLRLAPLALSSARETLGMSLIFWLVFSCKARSALVVNSKK